MNRELSNFRSFFILSIIIFGTASCGFKFGADARQAAENTDKNKPKPTFVEVDNTKPEPKAVKVKSADLKANQTKTKPKTKPTDKMAKAKTAEFVRSGKNRRLIWSRDTSTPSMPQKEMQDSKTPVEIVRGAHQRAKNAVRATHQKVLDKLGIKKPDNKKVLYPTVQLFGANLKESKWLPSSKEWVCRVTQPIPRLGRAIFTYNPVQKLQFIFEVNRPPARNLETKDKRYAQKLMTDKYPYPDVGAKLESVPPDWKPFSIKKMLGYMPFKEGSQPFVLPHRKRLLETQQTNQTIRKGSKNQVKVASLTTINYLPEIWPDRLMSELKEGMSLRVTYRDWTDGTQDIITTISSIGFLDAKLKLDKCINKLPIYNFNKIKKTKLNFTKRQRKLSKKMRAQLREIVKFAKFDKDIKKIMIKSYTDSMGFKRVNRNDAKIQAQAIKRHLVRLGMKVPITAIGIGEGPFIGSNRSSAGRAQNRRSIITMIK